MLFEDSILEINPLEDDGFTESLNIVKYSRNQYDKFRKMLATGEEIAFPFFELVFNDKTQASVALREHKNISEFQMALSESMHLIPKILFHCITYHCIVEYDGEDLYGLLTISDNEAVGQFLDMNGDQIKKSITREDFLKNFVDRFTLESFIRTANLEYSPIFLGEVLQLLESRGHVVKILDHETIKRKHISILESLNN